MQTMKTNNLPRILIVGTLPYNPNESSRALDTYFRDWPKESLRMIFSNADVPMKGHCSSLFQITDYDLLQVLKGKTKNPGRVFNYDDLSDVSKHDEKQKLSKFKQKNTFRFYARKFLWKNKRWCTPELNEWVEEFKPEGIYICFSDDYFILNIAYYFAKKYNIPVITQIGDDYYFKNNKNLFLVPYLKAYKKLFSNIMSLDGFGVYISQKLADQYNSHFKLQGFPFYLASSIKESNQPVKKEFNYFGKIALGRDKALAKLSQILKKVNSDFVLNVYSTDATEKQIKFLKSNGCNFKGAVPYSNAVSIMNSGSFNIVASGFSKKDIEQARYSLSTKIADLLSCPGPIIAVGPRGDGAIDFLLENQCAFVIDDLNFDYNKLKDFIYDDDQIRAIHNNMKKVLINLFDFCYNNEKFKHCCMEMCK